MKTRLIPVDSMWQQRIGNDFHLQMSLNGSRPCEMFGAKQHVCVLWMLYGPTGYRRLCERVERVLTDDADMFRGSQYI